MQTVKPSHNCPVLIGSKFTGESKGCKDTESGTYWEVLPTIRGDESRLQKGLLNKEQPQKLKVLKLPTVAKRYLNLAFGDTVRAFWKWA